MLQSKLETNGKLFNLKSVCNLSVIEKAKEEMRSGITVLRYLAGLIEELGELEKEYEFQLNTELGEVMTRVKRCITKETLPELKPLLNEYFKISSFLGEFKPALEYKPYLKKDYAKRVYQFCNKMDDLIGRTNFTLRPRDIDLILIERCKGKDYHDAANNAFHYLEDKLREKVNADRGLTGSNLVNHLFNTNSGKVLSSPHPGEREGYLKLFDGAFLSLRNSTGHTLTAEQERDETLKLIYFVDLLLKILARSPLRQDVSNAT